MDGWCFCSILLYSILFKVDFLCTWHADCIWDHENGNFWLHVWRWKSSLTLAMSLANLWGNVQGCAECLYSLAVAWRTGSAARNDRLGQTQPPSPPPRLISTSNYSHSGWVQLISQKGNKRGVLNNSNESKWKPLNWTKKRIQAQCCCFFFNYLWGGERIMVRIL